MVFLWKRAGAQCPGRASLLPLPEASSGRYVVGVVLGSGVVGGTPAKYETALLPKSAT